MAVVQTLIGNVKGPKGDTGATGSTGPQGSAATITVGSTTTTAYGNSAQVTNVGTSGAAVLNFVIPQGKPGEATTKMGDLVLDAITTSAADFPSPQVDDTGKVAFGKIVKFFSDTLARFTKHAGNVATISSSPTTQAFSTGDYLVYNDQLYKVTANIANGGTLTPGTNISSTSTGVQLTSLNDSLVSASQFSVIAIRRHLEGNATFTSNSDTEYTSLRNGRTPMLTFVIWQYSTSTTVMDYDSYLFSYKHATKLSTAADQAGGALRSIDADAYGAFTFTTSTYGGDVTIVSVVTATA